MQEVKGVLCNVGKKIFLHVVAQSSRTINEYFGSDGLSVARKCMIKCSIRNCVLIVCVTVDMFLVFLMCNWYTLLQSVYGVEVCVDGSEWK